MVLANASSSNSIAAVRHPCEIASTRRARHHRVYDLILDRHVRGFFRGQRLPVGDGPRIFPRLIVVRDAREQPAQFDGGQHLATLIEGGADRGGFLLRNNEHACGMGRGAGRAASGTACQPGVAKGVDGLDAKGFLHNDRIRAVAGMKPITKWGQAPSMASTMAKSVSESRRCWGGTGPYNGKLL
jgi:hypothetical protein